MSWTVLNGVYGAYRMPDNFTNLLSGDSDLKPEAHGPVTTTTTTTTAAGTASAGGNTANSHLAHLHQLQSKHMVLADGLLRLLQDFGNRNM